MTTYNRGHHIKPTIESVLRQTFADFELTVVGDGCNDDTELAVSSFGSEKISWRNLEENSGSQSFPNNEGIRCSRGHWICYLGHDDLWTADHLARLWENIKSDKAADFVVSGCIYYGPEGSEVYYVTGLFDSSDAALENFFPPSSICHRRNVVDRIGEWRDPRSISAPVDCEFLLRAAHAGLRFSSTGHVTVHKFAAGHRYLSYLRPSADEQLAMLRSFGHDDDGRLERFIETSKRKGLFMGMRYPDFSMQQKGRLFQLNRQNKGVSRPGLRPLLERVIIEQSDDPRALDWHNLERPRSRLARFFRKLAGDVDRITGARPFRWSGPNPHPKILIPFTGDWARIAIRTHNVPPVDVSVFVEKFRVNHVIEAEPDGTFWMVFFAQLSQSDYTVVTLQTPVFCPHEASGNGDNRRLGIAVSDIAIEPARTGTTV